MTGRRGRLLAWPQYHRPCGWLQWALLAGNGFRVGIAAWSAWVSRLAAPAASARTDEAASPRPAR